ncbi:MAG TPA: hypothetical protein V6C57_18235, partial [Coleofasciculaceae cyanobacterium]
GIKQLLTHSVWGFYSAQFPDPNQGLTLKLQPALNQSERHPTDASRFGSMPVEVSMSNPDSGQEIGLNRSPKRYGSTAA